MPDVTSLHYGRTVRCGVAHGALAMTTPGDTTMATLAEVERAMKGGSARIAGITALSALPR